MPYVGPGSWGTWLCYGRLALAQKANFDRALMFIGAMLHRTQRAVGISSAVRIDVASDTAAATLRIRSDLFEDLDIAAATQQP